LLKIGKLCLIFLSTFLPVGSGSAGSPISERVVGAVREPPANPRSGRKIVAHGARSCEKINNLAQRRKDAKNCGQ